MITRDAQDVVIGSGIAGVLVARELVRAGRRPTIVERGSFLRWDEQLARRESHSGVPTGRPNHERGPRGRAWPWRYVYAVGGSCNHWVGNTPRLLPEDFAVRTRFGIARDWPISYEELAAHYREAERTLAVAGEGTPLMPGTRYPLPPHPLSPQDRAIAPLLEPLIALPQARPTRPVGSRPACCGSAQCELCPVDSRFSVLNGLGEVLDDPSVELITETVAARLVLDPAGRKVVAVDCVDARGERFRLRASRVIVAANGIEGPALLLRSGMAWGDTGRYVADHTNAEVTVDVKLPVGPGRGSSLQTGASYAYYSGGFRARRAGLLIMPMNTGSKIAIPDVVRGLVDGRHGAALRRSVARSWERRLTLTVLPDDLPDRRNAVTLSPRRDRFGLPRNRISFMGPTRYQRRGIRHLVEDLPRRLAPLGVRRVDFRYTPVGGHSLGSLRMGTDRGAVVDSDLRHHRFPNLFVSGGAVFPTVSPAHPTLTIAALAIRLGKQLAREGS